MGFESSLKQGLHARDVTACLGKQPHRRASHKRLPAPHRLHPAVRAAAVDHRPGAPTEQCGKCSSGPIHAAHQAPSVLQAQQRPPAAQAQLGSTTGPGGQPAAVQPSQQGRVPAGFAANTDLLTALHQTQQSLHAARLGSQALHQAASSGQLHAGAGSSASRQSGSSAGHQDTA